MIEELWELLREKETWSIEQLAETLETTPEMVKAAMLYLKQIERVKESEMETRCSHQCNGCFGGCQENQSSIMIWQAKKDNYRNNVENEK